MLHKYLLMTGQIGTGLGRPTESWHVLYSDEGSLRMEKVETESP